MTSHIGQRIGNYRLLRVLGQGAFAEVYLGEHLYLERLAAIKVLHVQMDPETQERFLREARTIARLQHPHILQVLDFGIDEQTPYLVMQYTPGGALREHHPKGTHLPIEQIVTYVKQIASALDYAHQQHVIHRDIKPHNLLLTATHEVVLGDFGLAVMQQSLDSFSMSNPAAGTPQYMAPEQIQLHPCAASDQYALGVIVYEWLAGEVPFRGNTLLEVLSHHLYQAPPSLREQLPDLPAAVEAVVFQALDKDPEQRFACVTDFASAFEDACEITQRLTMPGQPQQRAPQPMVPQSMPFVPSAPVRAPEASSASTQLAPTLQKPERVEEMSPTLAHPLSLQHLTGSKPVKPSLAQSNRQRFLRKVRSFWIESVLEHSLYGATIISLGLQEQPDALSNPWQLVLQHPNTASRPLPIGTHITQVYDAANGELLILGAPGSGKTTLLLELTRDLLDRAEQEQQHLMPVVFTLSSWAMKYQHLSEWFVEELVNKYQVPHKLALLWVDAEEILPLLDGLDEVAAENRTECIHSINMYRQEHGLLPLVVTSRSADYLIQNMRVNLSSAVSVQPLTTQQIDDYLISGGEALWALRVALYQDVGLRELAETPLMLSILALAYHDMSVEDLLRGGISPTRQQVFAYYVDRMLKLWGVQAKYKPQRTVRWLALLAKQLVSHSQTQFYIERMQPDWLPGRWSRWLYQALAVKPIDALIGLLVGILIGTLHTTYVGSLIYGLVGLSVALLIRRRKTDKRPGKATKSWQGLIRVVPLLLGIVVQLIIVLSDEMLIKVSIRLSDVLVNMVEGALIGLIVGALMGMRNTDIRPVEIVLWSWRRFIRVKHLKNGILAGLIFGAINALIYFPSGPFFGLFGAMAGWLLSGLSDALSSDMLDGSRRVVPNQGIQRSARNGLLIGLVISLASGLIMGLYLSMTFALFSGPVPGGPIFGIIHGMIYGLDIGLLAWLFGGGDAYIKHLVLRLLLWVTGSIPWNYSRFLDYTTERILLRKVGGGYIFIHRLLLEYFASLGNVL